MDETLFDEFGNYIGPERAPVPDEYAQEAADFEASEPIEDGDVIFDREEGVNVRQQIVLHEDKKYYPTPHEIYGSEVETIVQEEDTQPLSEPIIAPIKVKKFQYYSNEPIATTYNPQFLLELIKTPTRMRNLAVLGHLHHGKSSLLDLLVAACHPDVVIPEERPLLYMDNLYLERDRKITLKTKPLTLLLPDSKGTSYVLNFLDTPGHADFFDEVTAALRIADGVILVVDAVEGVMCQTELVLRTALKQGLPIILVINKCERLFLELKLPPTDAYYKLRHTIEEINTIAKECTGLEESYLSPEKENVLFASLLHGWIFSLRSWATVYLERIFGPHENAIDSEELAKRLWGEVYYDPDRGTFSKTPRERINKRTFVSFILEPLYKIYTQVLSEEREQLEPILYEIGVSLKTSQYRLNTPSILRLVFQQFFGPLYGLVDILSTLPSPNQASFKKTIANFTGPLDAPMSRMAQACDHQGPLVAFAVKCYAKGDASNFDVLVRVLSGTLKLGQRIRILGEGYTDADPDDQSVLTVTELAIGCGRYSLPVSSVPAGALALVGGIDPVISKTATIVDEEASFPLSIFRPLSFPSSRPLFKVAIEPVIPSELPKMLDGLRKIAKTYPSLQTKVEEQGEHIILGTGELYLDCALHDLRRLYAEIEIKVSDPTVKFSETVVESSYIKCFAQSPNRLNKLTIIAEPLEKGLAEALEGGLLPSPTMGPEHCRELARILQKDYGWDILAARSVWAFGPDELRGPNILIDDTLPSEVDKEALQTVKDAIRQGFMWATREGPLCEEAVRNVRFRIIDATMAKDPLQRNAAQIIPTVRRICYSAMLTAMPRLMEPVNFVEIETNADCIEAVYTVLAKRRGHITHDVPKAGSPLYMIKAFIPLIDSCGFEADLRVNTQGMASCQMRFDHWQVVPGDPLDRSVKLIPLEPSPAPYLSRDFMLKTRRRKGLGEDVAINKFFDEAMLAEMAQEEAVSGIEGLKV